MGTDKHSQLRHQDLSEAIIGASMTVLNRLMPGLDEKLYDDKKEFARVSVVGITKDMDRLVKLICWLKETKKITLVEISKVLGISAAAVSILVKRNKQQNNNYYINNTIEGKND